MTNLTNLASLLGHLNRHPHLDDTFTGASDTRNKLRLQVYPFHAPLSDEYLTSFAAWARTLTNLQPIRIHIGAFPAAQVHLALCGLLADGNPIEVVCLPSGTETDLLAANLPLVKGAEVAVETLYRLTTTPAVTA